MSAEHEIVVTVTITLESEEQDEYMPGWEDGYLGRALPGDASGSFRRGYVQGCHLRTHGIRLSDDERPGVRTVPWVRDCS